MTDAYRADEALCTGSMGDLAAVTQDEICRAADRTIGDGKMLEIIAGRPTGI